LHEERAFLFGQDETRKAQYNVKVRNIINFALTFDEFYRMICKTIKEMWQVLELTREERRGEKR